MALRAALADYLGHGLTSASTWAANGSNEIIQQLLQAFGGPGRTGARLRARSYSMHPLISQTTCNRVDRGGPGLVTSDWTRARRPRAVRRHQPDLVFLTSPNNPTGSCDAARGDRSGLRAAPGMVIVDEAYAEFSRDGLVYRPGAAAAYPRLVVVRTMSKAFALAGRTGRVPGR